MEILSSRGLPTETIPDGPARPWRTTNGSRLFLYFCGSIFTRRPTRRNRQIEISKSRTGGFRSDWFSCRNKACRIAKTLSYFTRPTTIGGVMDAATIGFVVLAIIILLIIARLVYRLLLGQGMTETLINSDNKAAAVSLGGFLLGVIQVVIPVLTGPSHSFWADVAGVAAYGIGGIIAMAVAGVIFEQYSRWVGAPLREEIAAGNLSAGIIDGAIFFASSQIVAGALSGDGGSIVPTIIFWAAGVVALIVFTHIFRSLTSYDDAESVKSNNVAAALGC